MERVPHGSSTSLSNMTIQSLIYSLVVFIVVCEAEVALEVPVKKCTVY